MLGLYKMKSLEVLVIILLVVSFSSGCSVIGLSVGTAIDNSKANLSECECGKIKAGTKATINLQDGTTVDGEFSGLEDKSDEEYLDEYNSYRARYSSQLYLPVIGDTLRVVTVEGYRGLYRFEGFDYIRGLSAGKTKQGQIPSCMSISTSELNSLGRKEYTLKYLVSISDLNNHSASAEELRSLYSSAALPLKSEISLISDGRRQYINLDEIASIEVHKRRYAKWIGLGIGVVIDAGIIAVAIAVSESIKGLDSWGSY